MVKQLYHIDSYLKEFEATIENIISEGVVLDQTAFYPGGGGQPCDFGFLNSNGIDYKVDKVQYFEGTIIHKVVSDGLNIGDKILARIDWDRRYKLMRTHTALHILCGVVWRDFGALVTGGNMEPLKARMDFELESMSTDFAEIVEKKINEEVFNDHKIEINMLPRDEALKIPDLIRTKIDLLPKQISELRIVDITSLDLQADGGTHVISTKEVGHISVVGHESKGKINKRLRIQIED
ncbi:MAG: alanyl-tRNA editing protein [Dehalococcoidia bacterium]